MSCYRQTIYCITEDAWPTVWSDTTLTQCPNNAAHSVNADSAEINLVARLTEQLNLASTVNNSTYTTIGNFVVQGTTYYGVDSPSPKYLKINALINVSTYDLRIIDDSNNVLIEITSLNNTSYADTVFDFDTVTLPASTTVYTIQARSPSGTITFRLGEMYYQRVSE